MSSTAIRRAIAGGDLVRAADGPITLPGGTALTEYDGCVMTGSALNVYDGGAAIDRQIDLVTAVLQAGVPFFGSCWGLQVAAVAAGGRVEAVASPGDEAVRPHEQQRLRVVGMKAVGREQLGALDSLHPRVRRHVEPRGDAGRYRHAIAMNSHAPRAQPLDSNAFAISP